jgi:hypothetical protein
MTNPVSDFPQDEMPEDEISKPKQAPLRKAPRPRGKSILGKFLFIILIAAIILGGILIIQQSLFDMEAQAQVYALQTAAALSSSPVVASIPNQTLTPMASIIETTTAKPQS